MRTALGFFAGLVLAAGMFLVGDNILVNMEPSEALSILTAVAGVLLWALSGVIGLTLEYRHRYSITTLSPKELRAIDELTRDHGVIGQKITSQITEATSRAGALKLIEAYLPGLRTAEDLRSKIAESSLNRPPKPAKVRKPAAAPRQVATPPKPAAPAGT